MLQYLLLDGAILEQQLNQAKGLNENHRSLYRGETDPEIEAVGPFLFVYPHSEAFRAWYCENGLNDHWGILVDAPSSFDEIYAHFRRFLMVKTEDGQQLYFRFYDPRVLRIFLPTCDSGQLRELFGPVHSFACSIPESHNTLQFSLRNFSLFTATMATAQLFPIAEPYKEDDESHNASDNPSVFQHEAQSAKGKFYRFID